MSLPVFWFCIIAVLWTGFFVLEGFDFGVGMLHRFVGRSDVERRVAINSIGPFWDGNEVWLIVGGAAIFAAFPGWYATWFSALYLALVVLLLALMVRGVSFEFRGRRSTGRWREGWSWGLAIGSLLAPLLIGVGLGDLLAGLPIDSQQEFTGTFWDLLTPYGVYVGLTMVALCVVHGATFLALKTERVVRERSHRVAGGTHWVAALLLLGFAIWTPTLGDAGILRGWVPGIVAFLAVVVSGYFDRARREGRAFAATAVGIGLTVVAIFSNLYPSVMVSSTSDTYDLTVAGTASGHYALTVMTVVAVVLVPVVLAYQIWTYVVFRRRVTGPPAADEPSSADQGVPA
jgi:cytochrome d ubiquinol oxidase subunit II